MLRAARKVAEKRQDFELVLVGTGVDYPVDVNYAQSLHFPEDMLHFTGEQTPHEVAQWMQQSDCFLFFSRYENAPVVISECLAIGLPIISSNAGGIPEMISQECGLLVPSEDEVALANAIIEMIDNHGEYVAETIRRKGTKYTYQNIGKQLSDLYQRLVISTN
jgi:glycosyltransferase involved in cell wall biosynthesis